jgi:ribonuclease G
MEVNMIALPKSQDNCLRDMGGIIVLILSTMSNPENRKVLFDFLKEEMSDDKTKHKILPQVNWISSNYKTKVRPEVNIKTRRRSKQ